MTPKELYERIGGDYDAALKILMNDALIGRFIVKIPEDPSCPNLLKAAETLDPAGMFEASHAMKGVYANLGLTNLSAAASVITEEFRSGSQRRMSDEAVQEKVAEIKEMYHTAITAIDEFKKEQ